MNRNYQFCLIAGGGGLPLEVLRCYRKEDVFIILIKESDFLPQDYEGFDFKTISFVKIGQMISEVKKRKINKICIAGRVKKPVFLGLKPDFTGLLLLFKLLMLKHKGDDAVLKTILNFIENRGIKIESIDKFASNIIMKRDLLTTKTPSKGEMSDILFGFKILDEISTFDIGQAIVIQEGVVLGVEAIEGTDDLIKRCGVLKYKSKNGPILVKSAKKNQTLKMDIPVIGKDTIKNLAEAGFAGIAIKAESSVMLEREGCIKLANENNIFIIGL